MKLSYGVAIIILVLLLGGVLWLFSRQGAPQSVSVSPQEMTYLDQAEEILYRGESGDVIIKYADELVRIVGGTYDQVVLRQVPAASGVKYEGEQGLTLWTKGDEVRIETPQELVFVGVEVPEDAVITLPATPVEDVPAATTTDETSFIGTKWIWKKATIAGDLVTVEKPDEFSVTFTADGQVVGDTDCNGFGGSYTRDGDALTLGEFMSTLMFCEGSQEDVFRGLFVSPLTVESVSAVGMTLRIRDGDSMEFVRGE